MGIKQFSLIIAGAASLAGAAPGAGRGAPAAGQPVDGIRCDRMESGVFHIHQHLAIYDHGRRVRIPDDAGRPIVGECLYWVHTHTPDGLIHIEAPVARTFVLGQFFDIWGEPLSATRVGPARINSGQLRVFVNGGRYIPDPRRVELHEHSDIVLEAGPPYIKPTPFTNWKGQ